MRPLLLLALTLAPALARAACSALDGFPRAYCALDEAAAVRRHLRRAARRLRPIGRQAARSARRGEIAAPCRGALESRLARLGEAVAALAPPPRDGAAGAAPGLPDDVAGYPGWLRLNAAPIPPRPGGDPHAGTKNVFVNQAREAIAPGGTQRFPYPDGTIVLKAVTRPGADFIGLVALMRKRPGSDPAHGDWTFVEYARGSPGEPFRVLARDAACWGCHGAASATDWAFTVLE